MREECWNECRSLDAEKMIIIQAASGSQYLKSTRFFDTANERQAGGGKQD